MRTTLLVMLFAAAVLLIPAAPADALPPCESASISGPSNVYAETSCVNPTWSTACACSNGFTPYFTWTIDGSFAGNGNSATKQYCPTSPPDAYTMQVKVDIRCGRQVITKTKSVFVSLCDNSGWGPPLCLG